MKIVTITNDYCLISRFTSCRECVKRVLFNYIAAFRASYQKQSVIGKSLLLQNSTSHIKFLLSKTAACHTWRLYRLVHEVKCDNFLNQLPKIINQATQAAQMKYSSSHFSPGSFQIIG